MLYTMICAMPTSFCARSRAGCGLIHNRSVSELPEERGELDRLARRLSDEGAEPARAVDSFLAEVDGKMGRTREIFEEIVGSGAF